MVDSTLFSLATLNAHPAMNPDSVIQGDHWRIGLITDALVRFEWSDSGRFVDDATQMAMVRDFGEKPEFTVTERNGWLEIDTPSLHISYNQRKFSPEGLYATVKHVNAIENTWHYGDVQRRNLGGTYRTLDEANGRIPVDPGVNSTDGWAIIDDSKSNVIRETAEVNGNHNDFGTWVTPKEEPTTDLYLFGYGHRYREAVHALYRLTGPTPLLPRFVLGNWWSRYHRYTETEYRQLVERFEKEGIPFTTAVIDMDWHLVDDVDPKYGSGWTGYTWNKDFFPDPKRFLNWLHEHGMKATLNVHPRDGVRAFEELYPQVAKAMNIDPESGEAVQFDLTDPKFMEVYFDQLHHPMDEDGVDFWWIDWQQGGLTRQPGLDPLWGLNHLHYLDSARNDGSDYSERNPRPLTFSRYAGPGSHRYPIGFSGDTVVTWESLKFQPEFTACASNIGYGWWSHDIGGHMFGYRDEELEVRWYQLGAFSPDQPSALHRFAVQRQGAVELPRRCGTCDDVRAAPAPCDDPVPVHDEPSRRIRQRAARAAAVLGLSGNRSRIQAHRRIPFRHRAAGRADRRSSRAFRAACEGRRVAAAGRMVRFLRRSPLHVSSGRRPPSGGLARSRPHAGVRQARRDRAAADSRRG